MVVRVSDLASALVNASPDELKESVDAQQELMPDKFRRDLTQILDDPGARAVPRIVPLIARR